MNFIDIILCIPLVWGLYKGFTKGLIIEAATIVAFGLGVWGGIHLSDLLAQKIHSTFDWQSPYLPVISFALVFLLIISGVFLVAKGVQKAADGMALSALNKIGGAIGGTLKFALIMSVVIFVLDAIEKSYPLISFKAKEESLLYKPMGKIAPTLIPALKDSKVAELLPPADSTGIKIEVKAVDLEAPAIDVNVKLNNNK